MKCNISLGLLRKAAWKSFGNILRGDQHAGEVYTATSYARAARDTYHVLRNVYNFTNHLSFGYVYYFARTSAYK